MTDASFDHDLIYPNEESTLLGPPRRIATRNGSYRKMAAFLIFLFPALGGLLFGYDIGATSAVILQLQDEDYSGVHWHSMVSDSSVLQGTITSMTMLGAMLGCLAGLKTADDLGRRQSILVAAVFYFLGSGLEWLSGISSWGAAQGTSVLIVGRIMYGLGVGFAMQGAPAYIGEMAPSDIRGLLVSLKEAFIVLGMLLGYSIGYLYSKTSGGWRIVYGWASPLAVVMFVGMYFLPPSAPWLASQRRLDEAEQALRFVTPQPTSAQLRVLQDTAQAAAAQALQGGPPSMWETYHKLRGPTVWPALVAGVGMVFFQQTTGQPSVLYYANTIFQDIGVSTAASIAISLFKLIATLLTTFTVDRYGRKKLLYIGCSLMLCALIMLGVAFAFPYSDAAECNKHLNQYSCPNSCAWNVSASECTATGLTPQKTAIFVALFIYIGGYQVGFGPIVWLLISEIFPMEVRGRAVAIAVVTNFLLNTVTAFLFPVELDLIGAAATFFVFAAILVASLFFINRFVPETKGLSLEEIERFFALNHEAKLAFQAEDVHPGGGDQMPSTVKERNCSNTSGTKAPSNDAMIVCERGDPGEGKTAHWWVMETGSNSNTSSSRASTEEAAAASYRLTSATTALLKSKLQSPYSISVDESEEGERDEGSAQREEMLPHQDSVHSTGTTNRSSCNVDLMDIL